MNYLVTIKGLEAEDFIRLCVSLGRFCVAKHTYTRTMVILNFDIGDIDTLRADVLHCNPYAEMQTLRMDN